MCKPGTGGRAGADRLSLIPGAEKIVLVDVEHYEVREGLEWAAGLLAGPFVPAIFEGSIEFDGVLVRPDRLCLPLIPVGMHRCLRIDNPNRRA